MKNIDMRILLIALAFSLIHTGTHANAMIGVNFTGNATAIGTPTSLLSTDQPGVVSGANWNNLGGSSGNSIVLRDDTNTLTSAALTYSSAGIYSQFSHPTTANAATNVLYGGAILGDHPGLEVTISAVNIPYNLYIYASQDSTATNTLSLTNSITTYYFRSNGAPNSSAVSLMETTSTTLGAPTVGPAQYQVFRGLTNSSFTITTGGAINGVISSQVFGLQIVRR